MDKHTINLPVGQLQGLKRKSIYDHEYFSFEGIPFGKPPIGDLRFRAPQPAEAWCGCLECFEASNKPVQLNVFQRKLEGSEDCLHLNVYTKKVSSI